MQQHSPAPSDPLARVRFWYVALLIVGGLFVIRLFYLQVIRHNYYQQAALRGQLKQYEIAPERGEILAHNGNTTSPLVLNEKLYLLYADPMFVKDAASDAAAIQKIIGGDQGTYETAMKTPGSRYAVLAKKLTRQQNDQILALKMKGIGTQEQNYRTYPQGSLAAQLLGFVNDEGQGQYGIEQALNDELKGTPGELKAITDAQGVPLAANSDNVIVDPVPGKNVLLTIDMGLQQQVQDVLKEKVQQTESSFGSVVVLDVHNGAVKALAGYPSYNPAEFYKVSDPAVFMDRATSTAFEVGSIMKTLTAAAALDQGVVTNKTTYYDPASFTVDGAVVKNIEEDGGPGVKSVADILQLSLNTGATWLLMQMGGGTINQKARDTWHDYLVNHYQFGKPTGIEQSDESGGLVPDPNDGYGLNIRYANTAFGQGQTETLMQMGAAITSVVNGGTYYQPHLVDGYVRSDGTVETKQPTVVRTGVVNNAVSQQIQDYMEYTLQKNKYTYGQSNLNPAYSFGGKTGTAQIASPDGGYYEDRYNGTFLGYVGGDEPQYVIVAWLSQPKRIIGYAGAQAAAPVYFDIANLLINNFGVKPKV